MRKHDLRRVTCGASDDRATRHFPRFDPVAGSGRPSLAVPAHRPRLGDVCRGGVGGRGPARRFPALRPAMLTGLLAYALMGLCASILVAGTGGLSLPRAFAVASIWPVLLLGALLSVQDDAKS